MNTLSHKQDIKLIDQYQSATVIGLGITGLSVARYLSKVGMKVTVVDSRSEPQLASVLKKECPNVFTEFGSLDVISVHQAELLVVSPGVSLQGPALVKAKQSNAHIVGDIDLFLEINDKPVIAITGSNGKSTVTTLVGELCKAGGLKPLVAGNIGLPVLDAANQTPDYTIAVLELSSFQLETLHKLNADAVTILNMSADHMDRYPSMGDYMLAKTRILKGAQHVVLPRHDEYLQQITVKTDNLTTFDLDEPEQNQFGVKRLSNYRWLMRGDDKIVKLNKLPLTGMHNVSNVLAALALVEFLAIDKADIISAIMSFHGLPHRMQTVAVKDDVTWINDSKATNIGAARTALLSIEQDLIWIAGGQGKGADFSELRDAVHSHVKQLIVFGEDADEIEQALTSLLPIARVESMQQAVKMASQQAAAAKTALVLLSPACASLDMYENYQQRGDDFADCIEQLDHKAGGV